MFQSSRKHFRFGVKPFGKRFEGYNFADAQGGKSQYVYTQEYYSKKMNEKEAFRRRLLNYILSVLGILMFVCSGIPKSAVNSSPFMGLADCLMFLLAFWLIYILIVMARNKNHLTVWAFRVSALQFLFACIFSAAVCLFAAAFTIIYSLNILQSFSGTDIIGSVLRILAAACFIIMSSLEYNTQYDIKYPE